MPPVSSIILLCVFAIVTITAGRPLGKSMMSSDDMICKRLHDAASAGSAAVIPDMSNVASTSE